MRLALEWVLGAPELSELNDLNYEIHEGIDYGHDK
jgi:hypothetical protein